MAKYCRVSLVLVTVQSIFWQFVNLFGLNIFYRFPDFNNWKAGGKKISSRLRQIFHNQNRDNLIKFGGLHSGRGYIEPRHYYK